MINAALLQKIRERAEKTREQENKWLNPDAICLHAVVEGFLNKDNDLCANAKVANRPDRPKIRLTLLDTSGVTMEEGKTKPLEDGSNGFMLKGPIKIDAVAAAFHAGGEAGMLEAEKAAKDEKELVEAMTQEQKKDHYNKKREKQKAQPDLWIKITPGMTIEVNIFDQKKIAGMKMGAEVSIESLSFKGSFWLKKPNAKYGSTEYSTSFSVFWNFKSLAFIKAHDNHAHLYKKIPAFGNISVYPETLELTLDVGIGEEQAEVPVEHVLARGVRIPLKLSYTTNPDPTAGQQGIYGQILPNESVDDFREDKKESDEDRRKRAAANEDQDIEEEESKDIRLRARMAVVKYKENIEQEMESGAALVHNVVVTIRAGDLMRELGITRERYYTPIMEAIGASMDWEIIAEFDARGTKGNMFNIDNVPHKTGCAGNIIHRAKSARCNFTEFLLKKAFHPSEAFVTKFYSNYVNKQYGFLHLKTSNPHVFPNPLLARYVGNQATNKAIVPLFCLNEPAADYMDPQNFTICAVTSRWFAEKDKTTNEGIIEQDQILQKIGKLSQEEADKCLSSDSEAQYPVGENAIILIYCVRNRTGAPRVFNGAEEESSDDAEEGDTQSLDLSPKDPGSADPIEDRDTGAMDVEEDDE